MTVRRGNNEEVTAEAPVLNADEQTSEGSAEVASEASEARRV